MPNNKPRYSLTVDGKQRTVEADKFNDNVSTFIQDMPDATIRMKDSNGAEKDVKLNDLSGALYTGYQYVTTDKPIYVNSSAPEPAKPVPTTSRPTTPAPMPTVSQSHTAPKPAAPSSEPGLIDRAIGFINTAIGGQHSDMSLGRLQGGENLVGKLFQSDNGGTAQQRHTQPIAPRAAETPEEKRAREELEYQKMIAEQNRNVADFANLYNQALSEWSKRNWSGPGELTTPFGRYLNKLEGDYLQGASDEEASRYAADPEFHKQKTYELAVKAMDVQDKFLRRKAIELARNLVNHVSRGKEDEIQENLREAYFNKDNVEELNRLSGMLTLKQGDENNANKYIYYRRFIQNYYEPAIQEALKEKFNGLTLPTAGLNWNMYDIVGTEGKSYDARWMNDSELAIYSSLMNTFHQDLDKLNREGEAAFTKQMRQETDQNMAIGGREGHAMQIGAGASAERARNYAADPQKAVDDVLNKLYAAGGSNGGGGAIEDIDRQAIGNLLYRNMMKYLIDQRVPQNKWGYVLQGFADSDLGEIFKAVTKTQYERHLDNLANDKYVRNLNGFTGLLAEGGHEATKFLGDAWEYWLGGKAGNAITKALRKRAIAGITADLTAKGIMESEARNIAVRIANARTKSAAEKAFLRAASGSATLGSAQAISGSLRQSLTPAGGQAKAQIQERRANGETISKEEEDKEIAQANADAHSAGAISKSSLHSGLSGALSGATFGAGSYAGDVVSKFAGKYFGDVTSAAAGYLAKLNTNAAAATALGQAEGALTGQQPEGSIGKQFVSNFVNFAMLDGMNYAPKLLGGHPIRDFRQWKEYERAMGISEEDQDRMRNLGYGDLMDTVDGLVSDRLRASNPNAGTELSTQRQAESPRETKVNQGMLNMLADPRIPEELKRKYYAVVTGDRSRQLSPIVASEITHDEDGNTYLVTYNKNGNVVSDRQYRNEQAAKEARLKIGHEQDENLTEALQQNVFAKDADAVMEEAYNAAAEAYKNGGELNNGQKTLIYLYQNKAQLTKAIQAAASGEPLSDADKKLVNLYTTVQSTLYGMDGNIPRIANDVETDNGLGTGGLQKARKGHTEKEAKRIAKETGEEIVHVGGDVWRTMSEDQAVKDYQQRLFDYVNDIHEGKGEPVQEPKGLPGKTEQPVDTQEPPTGPSAPKETVDAEQPPTEPSAPDATQQQPTEPSAPDATQQQPTEPTGQQDHDQELLNKLQERRNAGYERGMGIDSDETQLAQIQHDTDLANQRFNQAFGDGKMNAFRNGMIDAVMNDDGDAMSKLLDKYGSQLSDEQKEATYGLIEIGAVQNGIDDSITSQTMEYNDQRQQELADISDVQGNITRLTLDDGTTVYLKNGDITNEYGGVMVIDENGETKQIPVSSIKQADEPVNAQQQLYDDTNAFAEDLKTGYQRLASGADMLPGQQADINISGQKFHVTVDRELEDGRYQLIMADGSPIVLTSDEMQQAVTAARNESVSAELADQQQRRAQQETEARRTKGIAGYADGKPDLGASKTDPVVAGEYLRQKRAEDGKDPLPGIESDIETQKSAQQQAQQDLDRQEQWMEINGDLYTPEDKATKESIIEQRKKEIADTRQRIRKLGEVRNAYMSSEQRMKFRNDRMRKSDEARKVALSERQKAQDAEKQKQTTVEGIDNKTLLDNYPTQTDAENYLQRRREEIMNTYRDGASSTIADVQRRLQDYTNGLEELTPDDLKSLHSQLADAMEQERLAMEQVKQIKAQQQKLGTLYKERNKAELDNMEPADRRRELLKGARTPEELLKKAHEAYRGSDFEGRLDELEPETLEEYVSQNLGYGTLNWEGTGTGISKKKGLKQELGLTRGIGRNYDSNAINAYLAPKGQGESVDEVAHRLWEGRPSNMEQYDTQDMRNMVLELLGSGESARSIKYKTIQNRINEVEDYERHQEEQERWYKEQQDEALKKRQQEIDTYKDYLNTMHAELAPLFDTVKDFLNGLYADEIARAEDEAREQEEAWNEYLAEKAKQEQGAAEQRRTKTINDGTEETDGTGAVGRGRTLDKQSEPGGVQTRGSEGQAPLRGEEPDKSHAPLEDYARQSDDRGTTSAAAGNSSADRGILVPEEAQEHKPAVKLTRTGDFYEVHGDGADIAGRVLGITVTKRHGNGTKMASFPVHALDTYLPKFIKAGYPVDIIENGKVVEHVIPQESIGTTSTPEQVESERQSVNTEPTEKQKEAGNYKKGHIKVDGFDITIENPKGSTRSGKDASGKAWSVPMHYDYGYIKGTEGVDGDHIDVYLSDEPTKGNVYVVDQVNQNDGSFDEHKVMYGFPSMEAAIDAYKGQYTDGWKVGTVTEVSREDFKKWVESSHRKTKPFADYKSMEAAAKQQRTGPSAHTGTNGENGSHGVNGTDDSTLNGIQENGSKVEGITDGSKTQKNVDMADILLDEVAARNDISEHATIKAEELKGREVEDLRTLEKKERAQADTDEQLAKIAKGEKRNKLLNDVKAHRANAELAKRVREEKEKEAEDIWGFHRASSRVGRLTKREIALRDALNDAVRETGIEVIEDVEEGQHVLDMANGRARQMSFGEPYDYEKYPLGRVEPGISNKKVGVVAASSNHGFVNYKEAKAWAKENVVKTYNAEETGGKGEVRISNGAVDKFLSQSAVDKSDSKDVHVAVLKVLPEVLKRSIDVETHPDFLKGADGKRRPENGMNKDVLVHRCYGAVSIDGKPYRVKITLKEDPRDVSFPHVTHSYEATKIELLAGTWENQEGPSPNTNNSIPAANLLKNVGLSYNPSEKVLTASEKRTKSIREQRVYHGSGADFDAFDNSHMGEGEGVQAHGWGTYVTKSESIGKKYAVKSDKATGLKRSELESNISRAEEQLSYLRGEVKAEKEKEIKEWKDELANLDGSKWLYTVEIPDDTGNNYIEEKQSLQDLKRQDVSERIDKAMDEYFGVKDSFYSWRLPGWAMREEFIRLAKGRHPEMSRGEADRKFSEVLSSAGVVGVHYDGRKDGDCYVIFNDKDLKITGKVKFFRTPNGEAYGYTVGGKIYIDPRIASSDTPIHEYAHLWAAMLRKVNPKEWENVIKLMKDTWAWDYVKKLYPDLNAEDEIADEALAMFSGKRGAEQARKAMKESMDGKDELKTAAKKGLMRLKEALSKFWKNVCDLLHVHFTSAEEVADRVMYDMLRGFKPDNIDRGNREDRDYSKEEDNQKDAVVRYRLADPDESAVLDDQPTVKVYRAMQLIDGKLYPPMMAAVKGKLVEPRELGQWEIADERPDIIEKVKKNKAGEEIGYVTLDKGSKDATGKKGTPLRGVAYNPYWHTSRSPLNDQFKSAWIRPNIVTVEVEVPLSELTSGYRAKYAKDPVGETDWHSGSVTKQLTAQGHAPRKVILSRYDKPVRVLSAAETAGRIIDYIGDYDVTIPENVVTPQVRVELEKRGIKIGAPEKGVKKTEQIREAIERGLSVDAAAMQQPTERSANKGENVLGSSGERYRKGNATHEYSERELEDMQDAAEELGEVLGDVPVNVEHNGKDGIKGSFNSEDNSVHVNMDEADGIEDVEATVCHEVLGHEGLKALFGSNKGVDMFGQFIYDNAGKALRKKIVERAAEEGYEWDDPLRYSKAAQEVFSDIAADGPANAEEFSLWRKVKHYVIRALKSLGIRIRGIVNDHDLRYYVLKTGKAVKKWSMMDEEAQREAAEPGRIMHSRRGKPKQKKGESMAHYIQRLREYEMWKNAEQKAREANDPLPEREDYEKKAQEEFNKAMDDWRKQTGIEPGSEGPGAFPKREDGESPQDYAIRVADYEDNVDKWKTAPNVFEYLKKADEEYRQAYEDWKVRYDIQEMEDVDEKLYGEPKPSEPESEEEHYKKMEIDVAVDKDLGDAVGVDTGADGARRQAKLAVIERRKNLESASAEDAIFIHDLCKDIDNLAKELGMPKERLRSILITIIEEPRQQKEGDDEVERWVDILNKMRAFQDAHTSITADGVKAARQELSDLAQEIRNHGYTFLTKEGSQAVHDAAVRLADKLNEFYKDSPGYNKLYGDDIMQVSKYIGYLDMAASMAEESGALGEDERVKAIVDRIHDWYDNFFHVIEDAGLRGDAGYIAEGYINHIWDKDKSDAEAWNTYVENFQRTKSANMRHRTIDTYIDGIKVGLVPKFNDVAQIMSYYSRQNNEAIANKKFLDDLSFLTVSELNKDGEVVRTLPVLNSHHPSRFDEERYKMYHVPGVGDVWVLKEVSRRFSSIFGTMRTQDISDWLSKIGKAYDLLSSILKKIQLSFSGFHALALTEVAIAQMGPINGVRWAAKSLPIELKPLLMLKELFKGTLIDSIKNGTIPAYARPEDFKFAASHLVQLGATQDYAAADVNMITEKFRNYVKGLRNDEAFMKKVAGNTLNPFAVALDWINKGMDKLLWNYLHDGLKIACFKHFAEQIDKRVEKEGLTSEQRERLLDEAGQYVNDTFGGQYWELLNVSPATLKCMRRFFLSPDWLVSTQRHFFANFGFGSLYDPRTFAQYLSDQLPGGKKRKSKREKAQQVDGEQPRPTKPEDDGDLYRQFRKKEARLCYILGVCVFYYTMMNGLNAIMRARDEEKEKEKADEIRKTNPEYKSPYELAYPDGMKWYDYTMFGNTLGHQTHLFLGRYADGTEMYVRWGKQFREFPEMFIGSKGLDFPAPMIQRLMGKANPVIGLMRDNLGALGIWGFENQNDIEEIQAKYGKQIGLLAMNARHFLPFSLPTQADKEFKMIDLFMPSSKGFTRYKTVDYFKDFIKSGDMEGIARTYRAATMNGINAEDCLKAAITTLKAEQKDEMRDGIVDVSTACSAYDKAKTLIEKKTIRNKMIKLLAAENYKAFTRAEAMQMVNDYMNGNDVAEKDNDKYIQLSTSGDVRADYRLNAIGKQAKTYADRIKNAAKRGDTQTADRLAQRYGAWLEIDALAKQERSVVNKLKKQLGHGNDKAIMSEIRQARRDFQGQIDKVQPPK